MTEPGYDERPPGAVREHPPFRMRERRLRLLPDLTPPTLDELRWSARQRRLRREERVAVAAQRAAPADEAVAPVEPEAPLETEPPVDLDQPVEAEPVPKSAVAEVVAPDPGAPIVDEAAFDIPELDTTELSLPEPDRADLRPWRPAVLPVAEPAEIAQPSAGQAVEVPGDDDLPPLVTHVLVVREPAPSEPGRIAVLDEVEAEAEAPTVTRLVPLPAEPIDDVVEAPAQAEPAEAFDVDEIDPDATEIEAVPLYWRLLRLRYTRPNGWLRALFFEGSVALAVVLVLAEAASVWTIVVLPFVVAVVVKANDVVAGSLRRSYRPPGRR